MKFLVLWLFFSPLIGALPSIFLFRSEEPGVWFLVGLLPAWFLTRWVSSRDELSNVKERARLRYLEEQELERLRHGKDS